MALKPHGLVQDAFDGGGEGGAEGGSLVGKLFVSNRVIVSGISLREMRGATRKTREREKKAGERGGEENGGLNIRNIGVHFLLIHQLHAFVEVRPQLGQFFFEFFDLGVGGCFLGGCYLAWVEIGSVFLFSS